MDDVLRRIENLSQSKRLISCEQVIMEAVYNLNPFLNPLLSETEIQKIQNSLLSLFSVNNGEFSIQCSLYIASMILKTMQISKNPQIWDLFNIAISNTTLSTVMAAGYVCRHIGNKFKSQLPRLIEHLFKQKPALYYPVSYCLRAIFKVGGKTVSQYTQGAIDFCYHLISQNRQTITVSCIKLLKALIKKSTNPPISQVVDTIKLMVKEEPIPFIKNEISNLIAQCAFAPLYPIVNRKQKQSSEWVIGANKVITDTPTELDKPLDILLQFPNYLSMSLPQFLNLLTPPIFTRYHSPLYNFVTKNCPSLLSDIISMLPADSRFTYFKQIASTSPMTDQQLQKLSYLCQDDKSILEAAGVALLLTYSTDKIERHSALNFFATFSKSHPSIIMSYLRSSLNFLCQTLKNGLNGERDVISHYSLATVVFSNIQRIEDAIEGENNDLLIQFFKDVFTSPKVTSPHFYGALQLLAVLPQRYSEPAAVEDSTNIACQYLFDNVDRYGIDHSYRRLLKSLFLYRETHLAANYGQNLLLVRILLSLQKKKVDNLTFSLSVVSSLCVIAPVSGAADSEMTEVTRIVVNRALKITPSAELLKSFITRPLPTGFDLLKITSESSFEKRKNEQLLGKIIQSFPHLLNSNSQSERKHVIDNLISVKTVNSTAHFILLQLCKSSFMLPKSCLPLFLKHLETNNLTVLEIISECVGHFLNTNQADFKTVFAFIEKKNNVASCLLLSSIFTHTRIPNQSYFSRSLLLLNALMKNGAILPFAIHAISSMLLTHSMQVTNFEIILNQFQLLFQTLNTNYSMQPVVLYLCAECFSLLVETSSSEISAKTGASNKDEKKLANTLIVLILRSVQLTPLSYSKEAYFTCCRAIITFAHSLLNEAPISFPSSSGASPSIQLSACSAFSDFLKFETWEKFQNSGTFNIDKITQQLLSLIQKTGDQRASSFLISLVNSFLNSGGNVGDSSEMIQSDALDHDDIFNANNFNFESTEKVKKSENENNNDNDENNENNNEDDENNENEEDENEEDDDVPITFPTYNSKLAFWVTIIRRVLLANSLFQNSDIEPSASVKKCCLSICLAVLPHLAEQKKITTEFLDDIISSASHSTETDRLELQEASFPVLQQVIDNFRYKKSEDGGRMLDLYDSQFSQAVTVGFQLNLAVSGGFLSTYLAFITDALTSDSENCSHVFTVYINGIKECKQRTSAYYSLATHLCAVSMKYSKVAEMIHDFLVDLLPVFADVFYKAASLWKNKSDWREMSKFRDFASSFYSKLLPSFVWLQTIVRNKTEEKTKALVSPEVLLSFCIIETSNQRNSSEQWMIDGALSALPVLIEFYGAELPTELVELTLRISKTQLENDEDSIGEFTKIILNTSKILRNGKEHDSLRLSLLSILSSTLESKSSGFSLENGQKIGFVASVLTYLINSDFHSKKLTLYLPKIATIILDNLFKKHRITEKEAVPLFSLIFHHSPSIIGYMMNLLLENTSTSSNSPSKTRNSDKYSIPADFTLNVLKLAVPLLSGSFPLRPISRFCIEMFKRGGMLVVGKALIEKPEIGFALLSQGNAKACFLLCSNDLNNCRAYLRFVQLCLATCKVIDDAECRTRFAKSVFRLSVKVMCKFGSDVQRGHQIVSLCVQMIQNVKEVAGVDELNDMFNLLDLPEKLATFSMMNLHISKAELKKRNKNLAEFSTMQRTRRGGGGTGIDAGDDDSEWQTLDAGDGSDSF